MTLPDAINAFIRLMACGISIAYTQDAEIAITDGSQDGPATRRPTIPGGSAISGGHAIVRHLFVTQREPDKITGIGNLPALPVHDADIDDRCIPAIRYHGRLIGGHHDLVWLTGSLHLRDDPFPFLISDRLQDTLLIGHIPFEVPVARHILPAKALPIQQQLH